MDVSMGDEPTSLNGFVRWLDECDLTGAQAARLLSKSLRMIRYYEAGRVPPLETRKLMAAIWEGYKPRPWPER
jgi:hypothetical protein